MGGSQWGVAAGGRKGKEEARSVGSRDGMLVHGDGVNFQKRTMLVLGFWSQTCC